MGIEERIRVNLSRSKKLDELFLLNISDFNDVISILQNNGCIELYERIEGDFTTLKVGLSVYAQNVDIQAFLQELQSIDNNYSDIEGNFIRYLECKKNSRELLRNRKRNLSTDLQEGKIEELREEVESFRAEISDIDDQIEKLEQYREVLRNMTVSSYFKGEQEFLFKNRGILSEDSQNMLLDVDMFMEELKSLGDVLKKKKQKSSYDLEQSKQSLLSDIEFSIQLLRVQKVEYTNLLLDIAGRAEKLIEFNEEVQKEKDALVKSIEGLKGEMHDLGTAIQCSVGRLPIFWKLLSKIDLFTNRKELVHLKYVLSYFLKDEQCYQDFNRPLSVMLYSFIYSVKLSSRDEWIDFSEYVEVFLKTLGKVYKEKNEKVIEVSPNCAFEIIPKKENIYYVNSEFFESAGDKVNLESNIENSGYWTYYYNRLAEAEYICRKFIEDGIVKLCKHSNSEDGVCYFYVNGMSTIEQQKVVTYMKNTNLLRKASNGKYYDIIYKFEDKSKGSISLSDILNTLK